MIPIKRLVAVLSLCSLGSCASTYDGPAPSAVVPVAPALEARLAKVAQRDEAGKYVREGYHFLYAGDYAAAARSFSRALRLNPEVTQFHVLAAIAYHLGYVRGEHADRDLAEAGYLVALRLDPNNALASTMLGRLLLESGRHVDAQRWLGRALLLGQASPGAYHAFSVASYYARDLQMALWAIGQAERLDGNSARVLRASALIHAASGLADAAEERRGRHDAGEQDPFMRRSLAERLSQWRVALANLESAATGRGSKTETLMTAQVPTTPPAVTSPVAASTDSGPLSPNWSDCAPGTATATYGSTSVSAGSVDETVPLPALPSPCAGRPLPRMAVIDAAIIRSEDTKRTSKGINLLDSLSITLGGSLLQYTRSRSWDLANPLNNVNQRIRNRGPLTLTLSNVEAGLSYSLNIANAQDLRNEVIARPSLLALDRQSSTFFSGSTLTTTLSGQFGGNSVDHPVGVSLSVTPTFIDDESMLLTVKAARSFLQADPNSPSPDLRGTVQTSRNVVSANVRIRFGETLALSGLSERENQENETGVPVLKEVPFLQYIFKTEQKLDFSKSLLFLITPRRPQPQGSQSPVEPQSSSQEVEELRATAKKTLQPTPNLDLVTANLSSNALYRQFRSGDLKAQEWHRAEGFDRIMSEIAAFLYY